jgi:FkbM family methyltransferase
VVRAAFLSGYHLPPEELGAATVTSVLDLGASIGATAAHFAHRFPEADIVAVELDGPTAALCRRNVAAWGKHCRVVEGAVWSARGPLVYEVAGSSSQTHRVVAAPGPATAPTLGIPIEDLIGSRGVDYIKMDIEGAEREVLRVNTGWATRVRAIKVEVHPPYTVDECATDLRALGFAARIDERHWACVAGLRAP